MKNIYCECPELGSLGCDPSWYDEETELPFVNHEPHNCKCINDIKMYNRGGRIMYLCSICNLLGDTEVTQ